MEITQNKLHEVTKLLLQAKGFAEQVDTGEKSADYAVGAMGALIRMALYELGVK